MGGFAYSTPLTNENQGLVFKMSTGSFNAKTASLNTLLYTVPSGKTLILTNVYLNLVTVGAGSQTQALALNVGYNSPNYSETGWSISFNSANQTSDLTYNYCFTQGMQSISGIPLSGRVSAGTALYVHTATAVVGPATYTVNVTALGYLE